MLKVDGQSDLFEIVSYEGNNYEICMKRDFNLSNKASLHFDTGIFLTKTLDLEKIVFNTYNEIDKEYIVILGLNEDNNELEIVLKNISTQDYLIKQNIELGNIEVTYALEGIVKDFNNFEEDLKSHTYYETDQIILKEKKEGNIKSTEFIINSDGTKGLLVYLKEENNFEI